MQKSLNKYFRLDTGGSSVDLRDSSSTGQRPFPRYEREQEQAKLLMATNTNYPIDSYDASYSNADLSIQQFGAGPSGSGGGGASGSSNSRGRDSYYSISRADSPTLQLGVDPDNQLSTVNSRVSLTVNYVPSKFSSVILEGGGVARRRKGKKDDGSLGVSKMGGGVDAFRRGEARMPLDGDEDYNGVQLRGSWFGIKDMKARKMRWNRFKSTLFLTNIALTIYSLGAIILCLVTWFDVWEHAGVIRVGNRPELILSTVAASVGIFTAMIGWAGVLLNNRSFLAVYTLFCWISFAFLVIPGYLTYKRFTFNLEGKINSQWSRELKQIGRLHIQNQLQCCGYFSPFIEASVSPSCYGRSILPGCKLPYLEFESLVLKNWYIVVFSLVPVHLMVILSALLCSNHVTYRFGKGMMPKAYRLSPDSMAVIVDNYADRLSKQYGTGVAEDVINRSRLSLQLSGSSSTLAFPQSRPTSYHKRFDSFASERSRLLAVDGNS